MLCRNGFDVRVVKVVPFVGEMIPEPDIGDGDRVICFGAYSMRHIARERGWYPGVIDLEFKANEIYNNSWGEYCLNVDSFECRFDEVGIRVRKLGWGEWFMRPITDSKSFAGQVIDRDSYDEWYKGVVLLEEDDGSNLRGSTICRVSICRDIVKEWRIFVVGDEVVTGSQYRVGGRVCYDRVVDDDVIEFVEGLIILEPNFADAYVIDVCRIGSGRLRVVEVNTINSAGFYHADVNKLIGALDRKFNFVENGNE